MRVFQCENCGCLFIVNEQCPQIASGDYYVDPISMTCGLCHADMYTASFSNYENENHEDPDLDM